MHATSLPDLKNDHGTALQPESRHHENRTRWVIALTGAMMIVELVVGQFTGSMALTADGWHMATHVGALGLSALAYWFARTRAGHRTFTFGTGKVYALAGYTSAVGLALVALLMGFESVSRLVNPVSIEFREALPVAVTGLVVNVISAFLLDHDGHHEADPRAHDHNLRAAYFHVLADALTSVLAIAALLAGRYLNWSFLDPAMGIVGGVVILKWSWGLCRGAASQLLDACPSQEDEDRLRAELEAIDDVCVADLHVWQMAPGRRGCIVALVTSEPRDSDYYRERLRGVADLSHVTVEVHHCRDGHEHAGGQSQLSQRPFS
jgi:cation diffusion facilitator family transporter